MPDFSILNSTAPIDTDALESIAKIASASRLKATPNVYKFWLQSLARELLFDQRVADCFRVIVPVKKTVEVWRSSTAQKARYRNLLVCGRVWQCPVCASTITEKRRKELTEALDGTEFMPILVTYTARHHRLMKLPGLLESIRSAHRCLKSGRWFSAFAADYGYVGSISGLEVTHGDNGWHPHIHELVLLEKPIAKAQLNGLKIALQDRWLRCLALRGYSASRENGLHVESRDSNIREYVAKFGQDVAKSSWTLEHELTKSPVKRGRDGGRTPFELLADYGEGDMQAGALFVEYAAAFKGRHQLVWSRGLRKLLNLASEKTDQELAADASDVDMLLASLDRREWNAILRGDLRGELLDQAAVGSREGFQRWLAEKLERWE